MRNEVHHCGPAKAAYCLNSKRSMCVCGDREQGRGLTSLKRKAKPMTRGLGGRKFFLPLIMKDPTVRYSPVGAVLETCSQQHALSATAGHVCDMQLPCRVVLTSKNKMQPEQVTTVKCWLTAYSMTNLHVCEQGRPG